MTQNNKLFEDDELDQLNGTIDNPEYSATFDVTYTMGNWRFRYGVDWIDGMDSYAFLEEDPATSPRLRLRAVRRLPRALHVGPLHERASGS